MVLDISPVSPSPAGVWRLTAIRNNCSTLTGWLAAWRFLHEIARVPWPVDADSMVRGISAGTLRCQTPRMPRHHVRAVLAVALVRQVLRDGSKGGRLLMWGFILVMCRSFALRMPSEFFEQFERGKVTREGMSYRYGPIRRKHKMDWCFPMVYCSCKELPLLCLCWWLPVYDEQLAYRPRHEHFTVRSWTQVFRDVLTKVDVGDSDLWTSHDVRRGSAIDIFEEKGFEAMLRAGGWRSLTGSRPYVSQETVVAGAQAEQDIHQIVDLSDPE